jgi:hypothetical protein
MNAHTRRASVVRSTPAALRGPHVGHVKLPELDGPRNPEDVVGRKFSPICGDGANLDRAAEASGGDLRRDLDGGVDVIGHVHEQTNVRSECRRGT